MICQHEILREEENSVRTGRTAAGAQCVALADLLSR
jgi:hypothetical protein